MTGGLPHKRSVIRKEFPYHDVITSTVTTHIFGDTESIKRVTLYQLYSKSDKLLVSRGKEVRQAIWNAVKRHRLSFISVRQLIIDNTD